MKKVLFATTALVATAGVAAADVTFSGYGRFGVAFQEDRMTGATTANAGPDGLDGTADDVAASPGTKDETFLTSRFRLTIDGVTEADNGLSFGARVRFQQDASDDPNADFNAVRFYTKAGGLEVGVGNILGVMDSLPGAYAGTVGLTGLGYGNVAHNYLTHSYTSKGTGQAPEGIEVIYSGGNWTGHISHGDTAGQDDRTEVGGSFTFNDWTVGLALATSPDLGETGSNANLTIGGKLGMANIGLSFAQNEDAAGSKTNKIVLGGSFEVGAATEISAYIAHDEAEVEEMAYGIGATHDLGGGASIRGGVVDLHDNTRADLGVLFNF